MKWNIITDSSSDLSHKIIEDSDIQIMTVPLKINIGDKVFCDDENINTTELLEAMQSYKQASSSACPSPDEFYNAFEMADYSFCSVMTGTLSGTYNSACVARDLILEKYPDKKIAVFDSKGTAGMLVLFARKAEELIKKNLSFEEIAEELGVYIREITLVFSLSSYDNLVKNGRLKPIVGMIASKLKIRTIAVASKEGTIDMIRKLHGAQKTYSAMVEIMCARKNLSGLPVVIHHCMCNECVEEIKALLAKQGCTDVTVFECRGITTYYAMPGGIIISY